MGQLAIFGLTAVLAWVYTELEGYGLHRLLHSDLVPWLSHRHLIHHVELYGPGMKMRTATYLDRDARGAVLGIGWEWLGPSLLLFAVELAVLCALGVPAAHQVVFFASGTLWSLVMFHRAHEAMHVASPSPFRARPLRGWFLRARRLHDVHHHAVDERGRFEKNFGIAFFWFDRLFGTYAPRCPSKARAGCRRACYRRSNRSGHGGAGHGNGRAHGQRFSVAVAVAVADRPVPRLVLSSCPTRLKSAQGGRRDAERP